MSKLKYYRKSLSKKLSSSKRDYYYQRWRKSLFNTRLKNIRRFS